MRQAKWALLGLAAVLVVTITCIVLHQYLHVNDMWCNLVVAVVWAAVVVVCLKASRAEDARRRAVRTCYLANGLLYNSEGGVVRASGTTAQVDAMQNVLSNLRYGFDVAELPTPKGGSRRGMTGLFDYVVRTKTFKVAKAGDGVSPRLVSWQGEVASTAHPTNKPISFEDRAELEAALTALRSE